MRIQSLAGRSRTLLRRWVTLGAAFAAAASLAACVVYEPVPVQTGPSAYDRSWSAVLGALQDEGVAINSQDHGSGFVSGTRRGVGIAANVRRQPDGTVRVKFDSSGATASDPTLIDRVTDRYHRRMGR